MPQLHAFPSGLLDLVGSMNQGENIREMGYLLNPIVDVTSLYLTTKQIVMPRSITVFGAPGFHTGGQLVVPTGEVWYVHNWSYGAFTAAGEAASFSLMTIQDGTGLAWSNPVTIGASAAGFANLINPNAWFQAGTRIGIWVHSATGAPTYGGGILVSKLRA